MEWAPADQAYAYAFCFVARVHSLHVPDIETIKSLDALLEGQNIISNNVIEPNPDFNPLDVQIDTLGPLWDENPG